MLGTPHAIDGFVAQEEVNMNIDFTQDQQKLNKMLIMYQSFNCVSLEM